ncbi:MAG: hypothetical protein IPJ19_05750 [Planctomycetes bacterium]|nr:hypothetical protein [Planctomycetota bacterium]
MQRENFEFYLHHADAPVEGVELVAFERVWDLHNCFDFGGFAFEPLRDELVLSWNANEYAPVPRVRGCRLRFREVKSLELTSRDGEYPLTSADRLEWIAKVIPGEREFPLKANWDPGEDFEIEIVFEDERRMRIGARSAVFEVEV